MESLEADPRLRFFGEGGEPARPFKAADWRGCGLDPDRFNHTKLPKFLFEAIVSASKPKALLLRSYTPDHPVSVKLTPTWQAFKAYRFDPKNWSLEYVLYDSSNMWAVLLDPDLVVLGAEPQLAQQIDAILDDHGTSLKDLTNADFSELDPANPDHCYLLAVIGGGTRQGAA